MANKTLVIMAAGMGSRYGGIKQVDPVGPNGEIILEYAIFDALYAGFDKVVFIINRSIEEIFKERIGDKIEKRVHTSYVYQSVQDIPKGFDVPHDRVKPWGTGHAVLLCKDVIDSPFAVIGADDYFGATSFTVLGEHLETLQDAKDMHQYCMVGFRLENTLSENGHVSRGICSVTHDGYLRSVQERTKIMKFGDDIRYTEDDQNWVSIPSGSTVSMNMWGFTPSLFDELEAMFIEFLDKHRDNSNKVEFYLPVVADSLISSRKARVKVLRTEDRWYGVTYKEDKPVVTEAVRKMHMQGTYPLRLWQE